jgi:hypothetical protein
MIHIEKCLGQFVARLCILWRPLKVSPYSVSGIVLSVFQIHNFRKDENEIAVLTSPEEDLQAQHAFDALWRNSGTETVEDQVKGGILRIRVCERN